MLFSMKPIFNNADSENCSIHNITSNNFVKEIEILQWQALFTDPSKPLIVFCTSSWWWSSDHIASAVFLENWYLVVQQRGRKGLLQRPSLTYVKIFWWHTRIHFGTHFIQHNSVRFIPFNERWQFSWSSWWQHTMYSQSDMK